MEKMHKKLQHVQVPNNMCRDHQLEPFDMLVYANIKRFMNQDTKEAFPSLRTLMDLIGTGHVKITKSISRMKGKCMSYYMDGNKRVYTFHNKYKQFEPFSIEFLDRKDLSPTEKSYIMALQQYMFKDLKDFGKVSFTTQELSQLINMPEWEIWKCDRSLKEKGYLNIIQSKKKDFETGLNLNERIFDMKLLGQSIIWRLVNNFKRIQYNNEIIKKLQKELRTTSKIVHQQNKDINELKLAEMRVNNLLMTLN